MRPLSYRFHLNLFPLWGCIHIVLDIVQPSCYRDRLQLDFPSRQDNPIANELLSFIDYAISNNAWSKAHLEGLVASIRHWKSLRDSGSLLFGSSWSRNNYSTASCTRKVPSEPLCLIKIFLTNPGKGAIFQWRRASAWALPMWPKVSGMLQEGASLKQVPQR